MIDNPKEYPFVNVKWIDSTAPGQVGWHSLDDLLDKVENYCSEVHSAGYLVRKTPTEIWVVSSYYVNLEGDIGIQGMISIPRVSILQLDRWDKDETL